MVDLPKRNPIRGGPTYKPGESLLGTVGRVVSQDLPSLAARVAGAWAGGARPATARPQGTQPTPDMLKARESIAGIESRGSGNYEAVGPKTKSGDRAHGRYQVMGANIPAWTKEITGREYTPDEFRKDPDVQNKVFDKQFGGAMKKYGPEGASTWWFTGKPPSKITGKEKDVVGTSASQYQSKFTAGFGEETEMKKEVQEGFTRADFESAAERQHEIPRKEFDKGMAKWWKQGYKSYHNAAKKKPLPQGKEVKKEKLDEFKSPWAGIDKAAADTARWRKNREERKASVTDAKTERHPGWLKGVVKDYMSAKYGVKKEEKLDEIYPPMWAGFPAHMERERAMRARNRSPEGQEAKAKGDLARKLAKAKIDAEKRKPVKEENGTQTSPGIESEEHPKKFELPEKYDGAYSVRNIYTEGSGSFYGGAGQGGGLGVAGPSARQAPRPVARPQAARPQAAAAPVAQPATAPTAAPAAAPSTGPTPPTPTTTSVSKPTVTPGSSVIAPPVRPRQAAPAPTPTFKEPEAGAGASLADKFSMAQPIASAASPKPSTAPAPTAATPPPPPPSGGDTEQTQPSPDKPAKGNVMNLFKKFAPLAKGFLGQ